MHYAALLVGAFSILQVTLAHPGHGKMWTKRLAEIQERAARPPDSPNDSDELLGDLVKPGPTSQVGKDVAAILVGKVDSQSTERLNGPVAKLGSPECAKDKCCVWKYVADEMAAKFKGDSGRCNNFARASVRLSFHDAGTWQKGNTFGGADGSMILTNEITRPINKGLEEVVDAYKGFYAKYKQYGVSAADLIQTGGTVATVVCPLGPRIRTFVGRKDNPTLPPDGLLPDVNDSADSMIALFERKTIKAHGLAALVGAHTTSQQRFFDTSRALDPQDSTPGVWDVAFYPQTLAKNPPRRVLKFPSDVVLSAHPKVADEWKEFAGPGGQEHWNDDFAKEMVRMGMLGVYNINDMTECTKVLPPHTDRVFNAPDRPQVAKWSNGGYRKAGRKFGELVSSGMAETNQTLMQNGIDIEDGGPLPPTDMNPAGAAQPGNPQQIPNNLPPNGQPQNGQPRNGQPPNGPIGQPLNGQNPGNQTQNGRPQIGQNPNNQPQNGRPRNGQSPNGQNGNGRPQPGQPQNTQPQNGQPPDNQAPNNQPQNGRPRNGPNGQPQNNQPQNGRPGRPAGNQPQTNPQTPAPNGQQPPQNQQRPPPPPPPAKQNGQPAAKANPKPSPVAQQPAQKAGSSAGAKQKPAAESGAPSYLDTPTSASPAVSSPYLASSVAAAPYQSSPAETSSYIASSAVASSYVDPSAVTSSYLASSAAASSVVVVVSPIAASSYIASSPVASQAAASTYIAPPAVASSYVARPAVASSSIAPPAVASSYVASPAVATPAVASPYIQAPQPSVQAATPAPAALQQPAQLPAQGQNPGLPQLQRGQDDRRGGRGVNPGRGGDDQVRGQAQNPPPYFSGGYSGPPPAQNQGGYFGPAPAQNQGGYL